MSYEDDFKFPIDAFEDRLYRSRGEEEIECRFLLIARETKAAYLITFEIDEDMRPVQAWLAKSQVSISTTTNSIYIPRWLVTDKELESYEK